MLWFDAHLDLAYLAVNGRDMLAPLDPTVPPHPPASVTLPALAEGGVRFALATIFTEPDGKTAEAYPTADAERAHRAGRAQLEVYLTWRDRGAVAIDLPQALWVDPGVGQIRGGMGVSNLLTEAPTDRCKALAADGRLHIGILMENADPIRTPEELGWWVQRGVCAIGLAWARPSRYAGGNTSGSGLTQIGRDLVREMDRLGIVHDASHLSDQSFRDLCEQTDRTIIASHSNSRSLLGQPTAQRHLTDEQIVEIARRGGVIGLNLFAKFIDARCGASLPLPGSTPTAAAAPGELVRPSIDAALAHIEHICDLTGSRSRVGLGSDMDGGFPADRLPVGIDQPKDLDRLADGLARRGWSDAEIAGFAHGNWAAFWTRASLRMIKP